MNNSDFNIPILEIRFAIAIIRGVLGHTCVQWIFLGVPPIFFNLSPEEPNNTLHYGIVSEPVLPKIFFNCHLKSHSNNT